MLPGHVGAPPDGLQHGVSIQISVNLGKTFLCISFLRKSAVTRFRTLSIELFLFLFRSILNGVTLKTSNKLHNTLTILKTVSLDNAIQEFSLA